MKVVKFDGRVEKFDEKKVLRTCRKAGLSLKDSENVLKKLKPMLYDGISTKEIYDFLLKLIGKIKTGSEYAYKLREAMSSLQPEAFEKFITKLLQVYSYKCQWNVLVQGKHVEHQVDVIAEKDGEKYLVECKHHKNPHRFCGLSNVLTINARMEDINELQKKFDIAWLVTNTKISAHAKQYSSGKYIKLTGWKFPPEKSLEKMIDKKKFYPITVLDIAQGKLSKLQQSSIITVKDLVSHKKEAKKLLGKNFEKIYSRARSFV